MKKVIIVCCVFSIVHSLNLFAKIKTLKSAEVGVETKNLKTIKTEEQLRGVIVEYKEDGTKEVTINLLEVETNKLPEKYKAELILEAPMYQITSGNKELYYKKELLGKFERNSTFKLNKRNITKSGTFLIGGVDNYPEGLDVKIEDNGNIFILDLYNGRIQKFNSKGKHIKNIPIKDYFEFRGANDGYPVVVKDEIEIGREKIYVRDRVNNRIEVMNDNGTVLEIIDIPEKIGYKDTRDMKMWADEEGVGIRDATTILLLKKDKIYDAGKKKINDFVFLKQKKIIKKNYRILFKGKEEIYTLIHLRNDNFNNGIYYISAEKGIKILKISENGQLLALLNEENYWRKGDCIFRPLIENRQNSRKIDKFGNIYLLQISSCNKAFCVGKIRIVRIFSIKQGK